MSRIPLGVMAKPKVVSSVQPVSYPYLYTVTSGIIHKIQTSDMTTVASSTDNYGENYCRAILIVGSYIYVGGDDGEVKKYNLSNLSYTGISSTGGQGNSTSLVYHNGVIYHSFSNNYIRTLNPSTLEEITRSESSFGTINDVKLYNGYLYAATSRSRIWKINPDDLNDYIYETFGSASTAAHLTYMDFYNGCLYVGGTNITSWGMAKISPDDLSLLAETTEYFNTQSTGLLVAENKIFTYYQYSIVGIFNANDLSLIETVPGLFSSTLFHGTKDDDYLYFVEGRRNIVKLDPKSYSAEVASNYVGYQTIRCIGHTQ